MRVGGGDVRRRRQRHGGGACWHEAGPRGDRRDAAAVRPRRRDRVSARAPAVPGSDIHDARRVADHLGIAHYVIDAEARFRASVIAEFADSPMPAGETPVPCVRCNHEREVHRSDGAGPGSGCRAAGDRALRAPAWMGADGAGAASCGGSGARPELVPVRHHARRNWPADAVPAGRDAGQGDACGAEAVRLGHRGGGEAGQPGHLLRAERHPMPIAVGPAAPRCRPHPGDMVDRGRRRGRAPCRGCAATRWDRPGGWGRPRRMRRRATRRGGGLASTPPAAGWWSAAAPVGRRELRLRET